jgi:hypothetical protein
MPVKEYRDYLIQYAPPPIPDRRHDWQFAHKDYDGPGDRRCGDGRSIDDCKAQIDELIEELPAPTQAVTDGPKHEAIRRWERTHGCQ